MSRAAEPSPAAAPTTEAGPRALPPSAPLWFARVVRAFLRRELLEVARYRAAFLTRLLGVALAAFSLYFFARFVGATANQHLAPYGGDYLGFALAGLVVAQLQQVGTTALATRVRMAQLMGFLEAQLSTPAPAWIVLGAPPVYELATALLRFVLYLAGAAVVLGVRLEPHLLTLVIGVPLSLAAFFGLGLVAAAVTMVTRRSSPLGVVLSGASALLSGVVYPVSVLPPWLADLGRALPLTHALEVVRRGLLTGAAPADVAGALSALAGFAFVFVGAGVGAFLWALRRARIDGSLSHF